MEKVCPLCNHLNNELYKCIVCGGIMVDKGRVQEYYDDYSAEEEIEDSSEYCFHVFCCKECGELARKNIEKIII